jgi:hypothetical protein
MGFSAGVVGYAQDWQELEKTRAATYARPAGAAGHSSWANSAQRRGHPATRREWGGLV